MQYVLTALPMRTIFLGFGLVACGSFASPGSATLEQRIPLGVTAPRIFASDSLTNDRVALGRDLFFDERLSEDGAVSCASCHVPGHAFAEPHAVSHGLGHSARKRNTPTLLNSGLQRLLDWDGRSASLEEQLYGVFSRSGDMGIDIGDAAEIVRRDPRYRKRFVRAFGGDPNVDYLTRALGAFERSLLSGDSRFDRYFFGGDSAALSPAERRGWTMFTTKGECAGCHAVLFPDLRGRGASLFTDLAFHNLGVGYENGRMLDVGRYAVTRNPEDWGAFKTPSLRNVALTAPYMHDGSLSTLADVIEFYANGGTPNPGLDPAIRPRKLSAGERNDLIAFLHALTSQALETTGIDSRR